MPRSKQTDETKLKLLQIKYAHERDALAWVFDKAFEVAEEELNTDDVFHFTTLARLAKQHDIGVDKWKRWEDLSDRIHELMKAEDAAEAVELSERG